MKNSNNINYDYKTEKVCDTFLFEMKRTKNYVINRASEKGIIKKLFIVIIICNFNEFKCNNIFGIVYYNLPRKIFCSAV